MPFPTTGILDTFDRANETPLSNGGKWSAPLYDSEANRLSVNTNQAALNSDGSGSTVGPAYWSDSQFGPDSEVTLVLDTAANVASIFVRVQSPGSTAMDGYRSGFRTIQQDCILSRADNGVFTQLGATTAVSIASGDTIGLEAMGSNLTPYRKTGGTWSSVLSESDATYSGAGYIAMALQLTTVRANDFGGGTISAAAAVGDLGFIRTDRIRSRRTSW